MFSKKLRTYKNFNYFFVITTGPTLSPVVLLCGPWLPSQYGQFFDFQHLQNADLSPKFSIGMTSATFGSSFLILLFIG